MLVIFSFLAHGDLRLFQANSTKLVTRLTLYHVRV